MKNEFLYAMQNILKTSYIGYCNSLVHFSKIFKKEMS